MIRPIVCFLSRSLISVKIGYLRQGRMSTSEMVGVSDTETIPSPAPRVFLNSMRSRVRLRI